MEREMGRMELSRAMGSLWRRRRGLSRQRGMTHPQLIGVAGHSTCPSSQHHMGLAFHDSGDRRVWQGTRRPWTAIVDIIMLVASFPTA
jgi:hypothetical protein